jgi:OB-fold nucleic acid binding domain/Replication protein A C terminal
MSWRSSASGKQSKPVSGGAASAAHGGGFKPKPRGGPTTFSSYAANGAVPAGGGNGGGGSKFRKDGKFASNDMNSKTNSGGGGDRGPRISLHPGTASQLQLAVADPREPGRLRIYGKVLSEVTVVGEVRNVDQKDLSCMSFTLADHTGEINVKLLAETDRETDPALQIGNTVRVFGSLRTTPATAGAGGAASAGDGGGSSKNHLFLSAYMVRVATADEAEFHKVDAQFTQQLLERKSVPAKESTLPTNDSKKESNAKNDTMPGAAHVDSAGAGNEKSTTAEDSVCEDTVLAALEPTRASDIGMTLEEVCTAGTGLAPAAIRTAIDSLLNKALIYPTLDEHHFKLT